MSDKALWRMYVAYNLGYHAPFFDHRSSVKGGKYADARLESAYWRGKCRFPLVCALGNFYKVTFGGHHAIVVYAMHQTQALELAEYLLGLTSADYGGVWALKVIAREELLAEKVER